ncbi:hypothetical protein NDU88_002522 [Pleurodeles waltl]|uniref:Uncharacterized protein n=1 Tax=Pleurodeles waltl TaxID=8319 RepID=A0AAV7M2G3_PLEWA|nr:hypothetical protein NDU88_002522 [Pleurodeles waltl]
MKECGGTWTVERLSTGAECLECRRRPVEETKALEKVEVFDLPGTASGVLRRCRVREDAMEGEKDSLSLQEGDVCEVFCNVSEIMYGAITEQESKEALKEDVELSEICVALEDGKFSTLGRCVMFARQENSACDLRGDRREREVLETRNRGGREFDG